MRVASKEKINIVWFKRDLRVTDHAPLLMASQEARPVLPLYIVEPDYWREPFSSKRHWHAIHDCLVDLNEALTKLGQPLIIKTGEACSVFTDLQNSYQIEAIHAHEETGNLWTFRRDLAVQKLCHDLNIPLREYPSNGVIRRLKSRDDWAKLRNQRMAENIRPKPQGLSPLPGISSERLPAKDDKLFGTLPGPSTQTSGRRAAVKDLKSF